ncbi:MAG: LicD family protein [Lachnospiraceae bacterium]|nr:LicD family protein [uncultured Acetatifactor sp.]MCI9572690.1 LicD family protein [Lachnospiraceae bacterium]
MNFDIEKLHVTLIEILDYVVSLCEKHNIQYCLIYGSALGAYRHKGFIPWDDDMDIAMPRDDYEKFISIMKCQTDAQFSIQSEETEDSYFLTFAKVRKRGTIFVESIAEKKYKNNGIYIDIFPLDLVKNSEGVSYKLKRKIINYLKHVLKLKACPKLYRQKEGGIKFCLDCALSFPWWLLPNKDILKILKKLMVADIDYKDANYIAQYDESSTAAVMEKGIYFPLKKCEFEGKTYYIPGGIEYYLMQQYGNDYMELPPLDKRVTHKPIQLKF